MFVLLAGNSQLARRQLGAYMTLSDRVARGLGRAGGSFASNSGWFGGARSVLGAAAIASTIAGGISAPALAADNASIVRVQLAIDGSCTAASPSWLGMTYRVTGATDDDGAAHDWIEAHILDGNNSVIWSHTGVNSITPGQSISANRFMAQGATPADGPYTGVLVDTTSSTRVYVANDTVDLTDSRIIASADLDVFAVEPDCPGGVPDTVAPQLSAIARSNPAAEKTNADSLTWRVTFDEGVANVDASDFEASVNDFGATGPSSGTIAVSAVSESVYNVTLSGGELTAGRGDYSLAVAAGQDIADLAGNPLANTTPTGVNQSYEVSNTAPVLASVTRDTPSDELTNADSLTWDFQFSAISNAMSLSASDFTLTGSTAALSASRYSIGFTVTASGGDLASVDGPVSIALNAGFVDEYGNAMVTAAPSGVNENSYTLDNTAPGATLSTTAADPVSAAFPLTVTFSEEVDDFGADDITVGNGMLSDLVAAGGGVYTATVTPVSAGGLVTVDLPADSVTDGAGNANTAATQLSITALPTDTTPPSVELTSSASSPVSGAFTLDIVFSETVTGFVVDDLTIGNGAASDFAGADDAYSVVITPAADGDVTVDIAAAAAQDGAGNDNLAATQFVISSDATPPGLTLTLPGTEAEGAFTVNLAFSEDVTGFELADLVIVNGDASDFTATSASAYSAVITPQTLGTVTISVAAAAAQDGAGNDSEAGSASLEAISRPITVEVEIAEDVVDVTDISATATITNPGSQPVAFHVEVDVPWIDVDPTSGTIPSLGELVFNISVNALAEDLSPGAYTGTITVINDSGGSAIAKGPGVVSRASGDSIVVEIPLTISIAERYGSLQLVATTPGGLQRDESFVFASADSELDGLSLTTSGGRAASAEYRKLFGTYDVTQAVPQGWRLAALSCVGDTDNGSVIDLANGRVDIDLDPNETIVCTFANTRDEAEIVLATQRAIRNFMVRRADRILSAAPDLASRMRDRETTSPGNFAADINGGNRTISLGASLSGIRNHAKVQGPQMPGDIPAQNGADTSLDIWLAADYSALSDDRAGDASDSEFGVIQIGADWRVATNTLVGVMVQRDWMDETADDIAQRAGAIRGARVGGTGWMAGPYLVHELGQGAFIDVLAMWGKSDNTVDPLGLYEDDFSTSRYMVRANLTGEWASGQWRIRPSASVAHFEETQDAYTDSLGIDIPAQTIAIGRIEAGPQIAYHIDTPSGGWWEPSLEVTGVWDYNAAQLMDANGGLVGTDGLRADARLGVRGQLAPGATLAVESTFSGLGDGEFSANGARVELRISF